MIRSSPLGRVELELPRRRLSERLRALGIRDERVLEAFASVPRHLLIPEPLRGQAYRDVSLPIGAGQTISAPSTVAAMTQALGLTGSEIVLEIGTGSGYQAAILSRLVARVVSIERVPQLAARARTSLDNLGVANVVVHLGDGTASPTWWSTSATVPPGAPPMRHSMRSWSPPEGRRFRNPC
jgi:protein-L-isoaspartate(D-aspartate) O-methyltransferase